MQLLDEFQIKKACPKRAKYSDGLRMPRFLFAALDISAMKTHDWKQEGNLYLWRYVPENKNYSGWHLTGDKQGIDSLVKLLQALKSDGTDQLRTLNLSAPSEAEYRIPGCKSKPKPVNKLKVSYSPAGLSEPEILQQEGNVVMIMSQNNVDQYLEAFVGLLGGNNDIKIGNSRNGIWLW